MSRLIWHIPSLSLYEIVLNSIFCCKYLMLDYNFTGMGDNSIVSPLFSHHYVRGSNRSLNYLIFLSRMWLVLFLFFLQLQCEQPFLSYGQSYTRERCKHRNQIVYQITFWTKVNYLDRPNVRITGPHLFGPAHGEKIILQNNHLPLKWVKKSYYPLTVGIGVVH